MFQSSAVSSTKAKGKKKRINSNARYQSNVLQGLARPGKAWRGEAGLGWARRGVAMLCLAAHAWALHGSAMQGAAPGN